MPRTIAPVSLAGFLLALLATPCLAITPDDPQVQALVQNLVAGLEAQVNKTTAFPLAKPHAGGYGEKALAGYAHFKTVHDEGNIVVKQGVDAARKYVSALSTAPGIGGGDKSLYSSAICALLLAEVDPERYAKELRGYIKYFRATQKNHGGYSYRSYETGDISQTQYVMLALWKLDRLGFNVHRPGVKATGEWLLAVQDAGGGWPYQGEVPPGGQRVRQSGVSESMAVAGGSAVLIAGDLLSAFGDRFGEEDDPGIPELPKAIRLPLKVTSINEVGTAASMDPEPIREAIGRCDQWLKGDHDDGGHGSWPYYKLYTQERYESFKSIAFDLEEPREPQWYNDGVQFLQSKAAGGKIKSTQFNSTSTNNAFALLFLVRSTKSTILDAKQGSAIGGRGLQDDTDNLRVEGGQIKGAAVAGSVKDLLSVLEEDGADDLAGKTIPETLQLPPPGPERDDQVDRLERLARGSQSYQARRVAMRLVAQSDSLDVVPTLIYGLGDLDPATRTYARDGLRFISRKFDGYGMETAADPDQIYRAQQQWKKWYLTLRPGYIFLD